MEIMSKGEIREKVRQKYAQAITGKSGCCCTDYHIRMAEPHDFPALHELLTASDLTAAGVAPAKGGYFVAVSQGRILGMVGYEKYGTSALLRSFAVRSEHRKAGLGAALVDHLLEHLKTSGLSPVFLLTNTAERYLARFGFAKINRQEIPSTVLESSALGSSCPVSSICMKLDESNPLQPERRL